MGLPHVLPPVLLRKRLGSLGPSEQQPPSRCTSGPGLCSLCVHLGKSGAQADRTPVCAKQPRGGPSPTEAPGSIRPQA